MSCDNESCKMTNLSNLGELCCLVKVFSDLRLAMKGECSAVVEAVDRLLGRVADEENAGSLGAVIRVLKQHKRVLCSLNRNCDDDCASRSRNRCDRRHNDDCSDDESTNCCLSLCSCCDDEDCCPSCRVSLSDLLDDFRRLQDSRQLLFTLQKDLGCLLSALLGYYYNNDNGRHTCLPQCDEMFRHVMYLVKLCLGDSACRRGGRNNAACKTCRPDPQVYPIVVVLFLALYFGGDLKCYVEMFCCCCTNGNKNYSRNNCSSVSFEFCDRTLSGTVANGMLTGVVADVDVSSNCSSLRGCVDLYVNGPVGTDCHGNTYSGTATGVVRNRKHTVVGTVYGVVLGTYKTNGDVSVEGLFNGTYVELKNDPCDSVRNPYTDAQNGLLVLFDVLDRVSAERALEVIGDGVTSLGRRLLRNDVHVENDAKCCKAVLKDHSKKYRNTSGCGC